MSRLIPRDSSLSQWFRKIDQALKRLPPFKSIIILKQLIKRLDYHHMLQRQKDHPNPLCQYGRCCFSQNEEDGLTIEILRRLKIKKGQFCEFGAGNGMENNSLILLASGWSGTWIGGEELKINVTNSQRLKYGREWITQENITSLYDRHFKQNNTESIDVVSLDLDGNDWFLAKKLLKHNVKPALWIVEYNAQFPPSVEFCIQYGTSFQSKGDNYYGASLLSFVKLFKDFGYELICCNATTGSNAFFVSKDNRALFPEVPEDIEKIYVDPYFQAFDLGKGHRPSTRMIEHIIE